MAIAQAFTRHGGDWIVRSLIRGTNYIGYPTDLTWTSSTVVREWRAAEVLHVFNTFRTYDSRFRRLGRRPLVIHHHGAQLRSEPRKLLAEQRRHNAVGIVSTLDLWLLAPDQLEWVPAPYDLAWLWSLRQDRTGPVRIAHAPTDRAIKSTERLVVAVRDLQAEGLPVELDLIERQPWKSCLARKALADVYFDQVQLGYGNNAIEAWGMGIPVIAGAAPETLEEMRRRFGSLPFYAATEETITDAIRDLVESAELRMAYAHRGLEHAKAWHAGDRVVEQLKGIYQRAFEQFHGHSPAWVA